MADLQRTLGTDPATKRRIVVYVDRDFDYGLDFVRAQGVSTTPDAELDVNVSSATIKNQREKPFTGHYSSYRIFWEIESNYVSGSWITLGSDRFANVPPTPIWMKVRVNFELVKHSAVVVTGGAETATFEFEIAVRRNGWTRHSDGWFAPQSSRLVDSADFGAGREFVARLNTADYLDGGVQEDVIKGTYWKIKKDGVEILEAKSAFGDGSDKPFSVTEEKIKVEIGDDTRWYPAMKLELTDSVPPLNKASILDGLRNAFKLNIKWDFNAGRVAEALNNSMFGEVVKPKGVALSIASKIANFSGSAFENWFIRSAVPGSFMAELGEAKFQGDCRERDNLENALPELIEDAEIKYIALSEMQDATTTATQQEQLAHDQWNQMAAAGITGPELEAARQLWQEAESELQTQRQVEQIAQNEFDTAVDDCKNWKDWFARTETKITGGVNVDADGLSVFGGPNLTFSSPKLTAMAGPVPVFLQFEFTMGVQANVKFKLFPSAAEAAANPALAPGAWQFINRYVHGVAKTDYEFGIAPGATGIRGNIGCKLKGGATLGVVDVYMFGGGEVTASIMIDRLDRVRLGAELVGGVGLKFDFWFWEIEMELEALKAVPPSVELDLDDMLVDIQGSQDGWQYFLFGNPM